ncbi:MAG TPA: serine/threonine-protein kinase, partial [Gemmatimonadaceae bacterium]|nr:serine/threonine-protein kinase [Gemmatimonadaceae bacterium]
LQSTLGGTYAIERELGGGGMSRVFVAEEKSLGRRVVVKVLAPELTASISAERFRREIQLAAKLQHPHIVPLLAAGDGDGLLYYTMPFVDGESLRSRLEREKALPLADVVSILCDVCEALAYAHRHGVVHRDVKPENVLLSDNAAVVADFGIAKAISAARTEADRRDAVTLTPSGTSLGTPQYMAPEQAAGDPTTDSRADLYSLGVMAYEMLVGTPPFVSRTAQALFAAHIAEQPLPVSDKRRDTPPALAVLVMGLLEKRPEDRPQSADEVLATLSTISATDGASASQRLRPHLTRRRAIAAGAALALLATLALGGWWRVHARPSRLDEGLVVVAPFRVTGADASLAYLREGMLDLLAAKLTGEGGPRAVSPRSVLVAWNRQTSGGRDLSEEQALRLAAGLGSGRLLLGDVVGTPSRIVINARLLEAPGGKVVAQESVEGPPDSLASRVDALAAKLLSVSAGQRERLASLTTASLPALREYLDGKALFRHGQYGAAHQHFERAVQLDSTFALATLGMFEASFWDGAPDVWPAAARATAMASRLSQKDRVYLSMITGPRFPEASTMRELITASERLVQVAPDEPESWAILGDWLFHTGGMVDIEDWESRAMSAYARALAIDSTFVPALGHYVLLAVRRGDTAAVRKLGALYIATDSIGETAQALRWRRALMLGDEPMLADVRARLTNTERPIDPFTMWWISDLSLHDGVALDDGARAFTSAQWIVDPQVRAVEALVAADFALERGQPHAALATSEAAQAFQSDPHLFLRWRALGALYDDGDSTAGAQSVTLLERSADAAAATGAARQAQNNDRCVVEQWRLLHGDAHGAREAIARMRATPGQSATPNGARVEVRCSMILDALVAELERRADAPAAIDRLDSLMRTGPDGGMLVGTFSKDPGNLILAWLRERHGDRSGALRAVRRIGYVGSPVFLAAQLREQGRLAALMGDKAAAIRAWQHYLAIRNEPEPAVRGEVEAIRQAIRDVQSGRAPSSDLRGVPLPFRGPTGH